MLWNILLLHDPTFPQLEFTDGWFNILCYTAEFMVFQLQQGIQVPDAENHSQNISFSIHLSVRHCSRSLEDHPAEKLRQVLVFRDFLASLPWIPFFLRVESCTLTLPGAQGFFECSLWYASQLGEISAGWLLIRQTGKVYLILMYFFLSIFIFKFPFKYVSSHITLQPKTCCPLKLSRVEPGQYLDWIPPGKTRLLLEEVLVRPAGGAHLAVCVGPNTPG